MAQKDVQTSTNFVNEEIIETKLIAKQQSISQFTQHSQHHMKNYAFPQTTLQSTVKPFVVS